MEKAHSVDYVGWIGHGNMGDEALVQVTRMLLPMYELIPYNSYRFLQNQSHRILPCLDNQCSKITIFGGGTLLPDDITWVKPGKYNYLFGAGVKHPLFLNTPYNRFDENILKRLKKFNFRLAGVRDFSSRGLLKKWGIESEVVGDPCLSFRPSQHIRREEKRIAVNLGCDGYLWGVRQDRVLRELVDFCKKLKSTGYEPVLIPLSENDFFSVNELSTKTDVPIFKEWFNVRSLIDFIASCKALIGERLHSLVFSSAAGTPFIGLEYRPKCHDFSASIGFSEYSIRTDRVSTAQLVAMFNDLLKNWNKMHNTLTRKVANFRIKQMDFASRLVADIEYLPDDKWSTPSRLIKVRNKIFWNTDIILRKNAEKIWRLYNQLIILPLEYYLC